MTSSDETKNSRSPIYKASGILTLLALIAWGSLLLFTYVVAPNTIPAFLVLFFLLGLALLSTFTPLTYLFTRAILSRKGLYTATMSHAFRQSLLITAWIVFNLFISALKSWHLLTALVSFGIIVVVEILALGR